MKHILLSGVAAISLLASPAMAEDKPFSGAYLGVSAGYTAGDVESEFDFTPLGRGTFSGDEDASGFNFGGFAGYRHQFISDFVLGAEIGGSFSNADGERSNVFIASDTLTLEKKNEIYVSLKPGYAFNDKLLGYLIGGYQRANFELSYTDGTNTTSADDDFGGFHFGVGAEYKIEESVSLRLEYINQQFEDQSYTTAGIGTETYEGDANVFKVGLAYNF